MTAVLRRQFLHLGVEVAEHGGCVAERYQVADARSHGVKPPHRLGARQHDLHAFQFVQDLGYAIRIARAVQINPGCAAEAAMMFEVFVALGRDRQAHRRAAVLQRLIEVPTARFVIEPVIGSEQKGGVGRGFGHLTQQGIDAGQVLFRFCRLRSPGMHGIVGRVHVQAAQLGARFQQVARGFEQPIIDLARIDVRRRSEPFLPIG